MSNTHVYPEPPALPEVSLPDQLGQKNEIKSISPELPSTAWPWLIACVAGTALAVQVWALAGLLTAGRRESDFNAQVTAWETANEDRKKALDAWGGIQSELNANVDQLRDQASKLRGAIDTLQAQRDQLTEMTTSQSKTLESLAADEAEAVEVAAASLWCGSAMAKSVAHCNHLHFPYQGL